jgi:CheY-like chemotaxis protein
MKLAIDPFSTDLDTRFKLFHELMHWKVRDILLVSTPYDAWILEEDCRLSERIITEYRGLNLSKPPRLTWVRSAEEALAALDKKTFDLVLTMSYLSDMDPGELGRKIKTKAPALPVVLLSHMMLASEYCLDRTTPSPGIDRHFIWSGNTDILVALIKSAEDRMNADRDTRAAGMRVILLVQDSPFFLSSLLPILYSEVVSQTQALIESGLNHEHRLLTMRARPKILIAGSYEEALELFEHFGPYVLGVISDVNIRREEQTDRLAGLDLLGYIQRERFDIPLLLTGMRDDQPAAERVCASFVDKLSPFLQNQVRSFFKEQLGFGEFIFRRPDGSAIDRADNLRTLAEGILSIPDDAFVLHCQRNDFSRWLFARTEIVLASKLRPLSDDDFPDLASHRRYLADIIQTRHRRRHMGIVANFDAADRDPEIEFSKIGKGSLGGKARGLAFAGSLLRHNPQLHQAFGTMRIRIPQTLVITTEGFDRFVEEDGLAALASTDLPDEAIAAKFLAGTITEELHDTLRTFLQHARYPLAVRSSSLLEDAQLHAYAGLYRTYMLPNDHPDLEQRLTHLIQAVKLVYASTYFRGPRAYAKRVGHRTEEEKMAVIIQQLVGSRYGDFFYPAISGVAQSYNYYPQSRIKPEDGIAVIALGLGKMVVSGERSLRFCPKYPKLLPQRSSVDDILAFAQRGFYALRLGHWPQLGLDEGATLVRRELSAATEEAPLRFLNSTYVPEEHRIRDTIQVPGVRVLTFAAVLKYGLWPLAEILREMLALFEEGMGRPVEIEFSLDFTAADQSAAEFVLLQVRPMTAREASAQVSIADAEIGPAICFSQNAIGNTCDSTVTDILYVKPDLFEAAHTRKVATQVAELNALLERAGRKYVLVGPGRWGSEDPWLGIPVQWTDISGVAAIIETTSAELKVEPSQGSHFFHNLAALEISYLCVTDAAPDTIDWQWLAEQPIVHQTTHVAHLHLSEPLILKVDGRTSRGLLARRAAGCDPNGTYNRDCGPVPMS